LGEQLLQRLPVEPHQEGVVEVEKRGAEIAGRPLEVVESGTGAGHLDGLAAAANDDFLYRAQDGLGIGIAEGRGSG